MNDTDCRLSVKRPGVHLYGYDNEFIWLSADSDSDGQLSQAEVAAFLQANPGQTHTTASRALPPRL